MKQEKKNDVAVLLDYAGSRRGPDLFRSGSIGVVHAFQHGSLHLHLADSPEFNCRSTRVDAGTEYIQIRLDCFLLCGRRYYPVFCRSDVYPPTAFPHSFQHTKAMELLI